MRRVIEVAGKDNYVKYLCEGWWCSRCRMRYECYTLNDNEELVIDDYRWADHRFNMAGERSAIGVTTQEDLFGMEVSGFTWYTDKWSDDLQRETARNAMIW